MATSRNLQGFATAALIAAALLAWTSPARAQGKGGSGRTTPAEETVGKVTAKVRVGAAFIASFPIGALSDIGDPALGATGSIHILTKSGLAFGVVGVRQVTTLRTTVQGADLSATSGGASVRYEFLRWPFHTRPFISLDAGYTFLQTAGAGFTAELRETSNAFFAIPQVGIRGYVGSRLGIEAAAQYTHIYTRDSLDVMGRKLNHLTGMGLIFGLVLAI